MQPIGPDPLAVEAKRKLNQDFFENARLPNMVSLFHYVLPAGHAALSVSGNSYGFYPGGGSAMDERLEMALHKAAMGEDLVWEARVATTPKRLQALEKKLDETRYYPCWDCSEAACRLIRQEINPNIKISAPISISPALVRWRWAQLVDNRTVFPGVFHRNPKSSWLSPTTIQKICVVAECVLMAVAVKASAAALSAALGNLLPNCWPPGF
ncbi:MAG: hypothetical protein JSR37_01265 [Verrucomicrobia bacterium]|nr:hypothetical protein [Verrucomicrobiota bacterium]MBS0636082.1 hypothetical protein [Verrucomicrobiota bacterium]